LHADVIYGSSSDSTVILHDVDKFYDDIVEALFFTSSLLIPKQKQNFYKFWCDEELDILKESSITSYKMWTSAGKPRSGLLFNTMHKDKRAYKYAIKVEEKDNREQFSDALHDALLEKDMNCFWKSWRAKFSKRKSLFLIDGDSDSKTVADKFAKLFQTAFVPNSDAQHAKLKVDFEQRFSYYVDNPSSGLSCNVELVDTCISKLKRGRAAGYDKITVEHLTHAHPNLVTLLSMLFRMILK
jgi:hypothetical protein